MSPRDRTVAFQRAPVAFLLRVAAEFVLILLARLSVTAGSRLGDLFVRAAWRARP